MSRSYPPHLAAVIGLQSLLNSWGESVIPSCFVYSLGKRFWIRLQKISDDSCGGEIRPKHDCDKSEEDVRECGVATPCRLNVMSFPFWALSYYRWVTSRIYPWSHWYDGTYTQQTWDVGPTLVYCWANVVDGGSTVNQRWANVSCLLAYVYYLCHIFTLWSVKSLCHYGTWTHQVPTG